MTKKITPAEKKFPTGTVFIQLILMLLHQISCHDISRIILNHEIIEDALHIVLHGKEYIEQALLFAFILPLPQSHIVEHFFIVVDEERNNIRGETHFQSK